LIREFSQDTPGDTPIDSLIIRPARDYRRQLWKVWPGVAVPSLRPARKRMLVR
jgi:hypothetical protein